jgi:hypothetical protein
MGKHAAPGYGRFTRELSSFAVRLLVVAVVFFGAIFVLVTYVPDWLGGGDEIAQPAVEQSTSTMTGSTSSVLDSAITTPSTSLPPAPTTSTTATTTTTVPDERAPADITVIVLNSTSRSGLAASATSVLADLGYLMLEPDNATPVLSGTQIQFTTGFALEAYTLAAQFPDGEVLQNPSADPQANIVVILGTSYVP